MKLFNNCLKLVQVVILQHDLPDKGWQANLRLTPQSTPIVRLSSVVRLGENQQNTRRQIIIFGRSEILLRE